MRLNFSDIVALLQATTDEPLVTDNKPNTPLQRSRSRARSLLKGCGDSTPSLGTGSSSTSDLLAIARALTPQQSSPEMLATRTTFVPKPLSAESHMDSSANNVPMFSYDRNSPIKAISIRNIRSTTAASDDEPESGTCVMEAAAAAAAAATAAAGGSAFLGSHVV